MPTRKKTAKKSELYHNLILSRNEVREPSHSSVIGPVVRLEVL